MLPSLGKRAILAKRLGPSESEPIEAKPSLFGPTKRQPPKSQPGRAAKRPLASGCPPPRIWARGLLGAPAAAALAREGPLDWAQAKPLGRPQQGPWPGFRFPATQPTDRGTRPGKRRKAPKPDRQPGQSRETTAKAPPDPWEPAGLAVPGWRAAAKGPAGPSHQAAWASGQTNPPGEPQLWRLLVWM